MYLSHIRPPDIHLRLINAHPRDQHIQFEEEGHKYTVLTDPDSKYTSVTTWCHSHFPTFDADAVITGMMRGRNWKPGHKYWGMSKEEIKAQWTANGSAVSQAGTDLHYRIECFMNIGGISPRPPVPSLPLQSLVEDEEGKDLPFAISPPSAAVTALTHRELLDQPVANRNISEDVKEWVYFLNFVADHPDMKPYRTEWMIYDEDIKISGSIDMVYENEEDGTLSIFDWKRCKQITKVNPYNKFAISPEFAEMPDSNFWHYSLQLNTYKVILETKYNKRVRDLYLVQLHPEADAGNYELYLVPDLSSRIREVLYTHTHPVPSNFEKHT